MSTTPDVSTANNESTAIAPAAKAGTLAKRQPRLGSRVTAMVVRTQESKIQQWAPSDFVHKDAKKMSETDRRIAKGSLLHLATAYNEAVPLDEQPEGFGGLTLGEILYGLFYGYGTTLAEIEDSEVDSRFADGALVKEMSSKADQSANYQWHLFMRAVIGSTSAAIAPLVKGDKTGKLGAIYNALSRLDTQHLRSMQQKPAKSAS